MGNPLILTCCVNGQKFPLFGWYRLAGDGEVESLPPGVHVTDKGQLLFLSLSKEHEGSYQCVFVNAGGAEAGEATVLMLDEESVTVVADGQCMD